MERALAMWACAAHPRTPPLEAERAWRLVRSYIRQRGLDVQEVELQHRRSQALLQPQLPRLALPVWEEQKAGKQEKKARKAQKPKKERKQQPKRKHRQDNRREKEEKQEEEKTSNIAKKRCSGEAWRRRRAEARRRCRDGAIFRAARLQAEERQAVAAARAQRAVLEEALRVVRDLARGEDERITAAWLAVRYSKKLCSSKAWQRRLWRQREGHWRHYGLHVQIERPVSASKKTLWKPFFPDDKEDASIIVHGRNRKARAQQGSTTGCWRGCGKEGCRGSGATRRRQQVSSSCPLVTLLINQIRPRALPIARRVGKGKTKQETPAEVTVVVVNAILKMLGWERATAARCSSPVSSVTADVEALAGKRGRIHTDPPPTYTEDGELIHEVPCETDTDDEPLLAPSLRKRARERLADQATECPSPPDLQSRRYPAWACAACILGEVPEPRCPHTAWISDGAGWYRDVARWRRMRGPALEAHLRSLSLI